MEPFTLMWWLKLYEYYENKHDLLGEEFYFYDKFDLKDDEFLDLILENIEDVAAKKEYVKDRIRKYER